MQFNLYLSEQQRKFSILCALVHVRESLEAPWAPATASAGGGKNNFFYDLLFEQWQFTEN